MPRIITAHVEHPQHSVELENTEIVTTEPRWFEGGVKEAIIILYQNPEPKPQHKQREV